MSCLFTLLGLVLLGFFVGPWVMLALQHRRQREQDARLGELQSELAKVAARLERALGAARAGRDDLGRGRSVATMAEAATAVAAQPTIAIAGAPSASPAIVTPSQSPVAARTAAQPLDEAVPIAAWRRWARRRSRLVGGRGRGGEHCRLDPDSAVAATAQRRRPPAPPPSGAGAAPPGDAGPRLPAIDWERWIGVRGAAVLGGIVLALAGILFVRYSIEHGLISPALRVAMGILAGLASIATSEWLRKRAYRVNADALAGAGIVLL
jgi:uncharacterized membrane protein